MPKTKKKKPEETRKRSIKRANLYIVANIVFMIFLGYLRIIYSIDTFVILTTYLLITAATLALLYFKDKRAADEALEMLGGP